jgi:hypothetical protein
MRSELRNGALVVGRDCQDKTSLLSVKTICADTVGDGRAIF